MTSFKSLSLIQMGFIILVAGCASETNLLPTLLTDSNRDGAINEDDGAVGGGALETLVLANIDDDDNDTVVDGWDAVVNGNGDSLDITRITLSQTPDLSDDANVYIYVKSATSAKRVNIWQLSPEPVTILSHGEHDAISIPAQSLAEGPMTLGIEGLATRSPIWDGRIELVLEVRDGPTDYTPAELVLTPPKGAVRDAQNGVWELQR